GLAALRHAVAPDGRSRDRTVPDRGGGAAAADRSRNRAGGRADRGARRERGRRSQELAVGDCRRAEQRCRRHRARLPCAAWRSPYIGAMIPLSVLDLVPIREGAGVSQALAETADLARAAEAAGYKRFWTAEHHGAG